MREDTFERSRFAVVMRGYDRDQVDTILEACERWAHEAQAHMDGTDARLSETDRRAADLEARLADLESRGDMQPPRSVQVLNERTEQLLDLARQAAQELHSDIEAEALSDRDRSERAAIALRQGAETRAGDIGASARRHHEQVAPSTWETRRQASRCLEEGRAAAAERADAVRRRAEGPIREARQELARLEAERQAALDELTGLRRSLEDLVAVS